MRRLLASLAFALLLASPARAVTVGERITSYHSQVSISANGTTAVTETIRYDFGVSDRHGIYRDIPTRYQDDKGQKYYTTFALISVTDDSLATVPSSESSQGNGVRIKIGDANRTITGQHTYIITYKLSSIVRPGEAIDRFAFNVTGNGWQVPMESVSADVTLDGRVVMPVAARCFTGILGSTSTNCTSATTGRFATAAGLAEGEGLSIELDYPKSTFSEYIHSGEPPRPAWEAALNRWIRIVLAIYVPLLLAVLFWPLLGLYRQHRRKKDQTVIALYESPDGLRPGELGMLTDSSVSMTEISATILDLAVRGYLKITQLKAKSLFAVANYRFDKLKPADGLIDYEARLYRAIIADKDSVELKDLDQTAMANAVKAVKADIKKRLELSGYLQKYRVQWAQLGLLIVLSLPLLFIPPVLMVVIIISVLIAFAVRLSEAGIVEWAKVEGFKLFLTVTEADRLKFSDAPDKTPELFNKLLPAAVALGVEKQWASQFGDMDLSKSSGSWYAGTPGSSFTPVILASSLSSDFGSAVSSGFAPISSSSGGGGGFSGGGGGGGGGGSW